MISIKTPKEIETLREAGHRLARCLREVASRVAPGGTGTELNALAERLIRAGGDAPAFLNYKPQGAAVAFPATLCVSVNDAVVHGIPTDEPFREGDIVGLDLGLVHGGMAVDAAVTVAAGRADEKAERLIAATKEALARAIKAARPGAHVGDIGRAVESYIRPFGYGIITELGGHGVGRELHEDPHILNVGMPGAGPELKPGMTLALEPMITEGGPKIELARDRFTFKTADGSRGAHFEHSILVTGGEAEILTQA